MYIYVYMAYVHTNMHAGNMDLVAPAADNLLELHLGDGRGNFTTVPLWPGYDGSIFHLSIADFDGDGVR